MKAVDLHGAAAGGSAVFVCSGRRLAGGGWVSDGLTVALAVAAAAGATTAVAVGCGGMRLISYAIRCTVSLPLPLLLHFFIRYGTYLTGCLKGSMR